MSNALSPSLTAVKPSPRPTFQVDEQAAQQYDEYVQQSLLYQTMVRELLARVPIQKGDQVLCLAAGTGLDAQAVLAAGAGAVFGLDRSWSMSKVAHTSKPTESPLHFVQADAAVIPFADASFDVVLINAAGNYLWETIYPLLVEVRRVLRPHGVFAFNCQLDELETTHVADPQRQIRRFAYLLGQAQGYRVRLSAKPSIQFLVQVAQAAGLALRESTTVQLPTTLDDVLQQLGLPQFYEPFLGKLSPTERNALLRDTLQTLETLGSKLDNYRCWHFFVFAAHP